jgi:hypothetical protein
MGEHSQISMYEGPTRPRRKTGGITWAQHEGFRVCPDEQMTRRAYEAWCDGKRSVKDLAGTIGCTVDALKDAFVDQFGKDWHKKEETL